MRRWRLNRLGKNRIVLLTRRYAIKLPRCGTWKGLLYGLLNNLNEADDCGKGGRCPVLWRAPLGFAIVMPRARPLEQDEFEAFDYATFVNRHGIRAEKKADSFGYLGEDIVALDYGW